jgi:predicted choloylglycine hydrolase
VWARGGSPLLVRNYDYAPSRFEGVVWSTNLCKRVIGMSDCLWGLLDGMNDDGLCVSLTFGGRRVLGDGFGIPIVMRYLLETCSTVEDTRAALVRLPNSLSHNLTVVDTSGEVMTAYLSPDREPIFRPFPVATNHQGIVEWPEQAKATRTIEREQTVIGLLDDPAVDADAFTESFLRAPLFSTSYANGFGTLYTAAYRPVEGLMRLIWPTHVWELGFDRFEAGEHTEVLAEPTFATSAG